LKKCNAATREFRDADTPTDILPGPHGFRSKIRPGSTASNRDDHRDAWTSKCLLALTFHNTVSS
jgi:hypothetical protein